MSLLFQAYPLARAALFSMDPEQAHEWTLQALQRSQGCAATRLLAARQPVLPRTVMGLPLRNPVGLAAGLD
jgi:dihydroorotate dehydrogenase